LDDLAVRVVGLRLSSETAMATSEASWLPKQRFETFHGNFVVSGA
jgi:hypothetical protein